MIPSPYRHHFRRERVPRTRGDDPDLILVTPAGSLPIRVGKQFRGSRKVGRRHQYVLNFVKGDARAAAERLGDVLLDTEVFGE